jgi:OHCU decarboxylase
MDELIARLNQLSADRAEAEFLKCCGSTRWVEAMSESRPFADAEELFAKADEIWWSLTAQDWLEAFRAHPKIGERKAATAQPTQARNWSAEEQSQTQTAAPKVMDALAKGNRAYQDRFDFIFIVCATGKTADEMLTILNQRLGNPPEVELQNAAEEQRKITRLRLEKLVQTSGV